MPAVAKIVSGGVKPSKRQEKSGVNLPLTFLRNLAVVVAMSVVGVLLLAVAMLLPAELIATHVDSSAGFFEEVCDHQELETGCSSGSDYFTDALMLLTAKNVTEESVLNRAMLDYRAEFSSDEAPRQSLVGQANGVEEASDRVIAYGRYWHGYLVYVKPLLCFFGYGAIRLLGLVLQLALLAAILWRLIKSGRPLMALGFGLGYITVSVFALGLCLQYWPAAFTLLIASLAVIRLCETGRATPPRLTLLFTVAGAAVNYFDLLTFPLITLGIPLLLYFALDQQAGVKRSLAVFVACASSWAFAYGLMWVMKWVLGTLLTGQDFFASAAAAAGQRSGTGDGAYGLKSVFIANLNLYTNNVFVQVAICFLLVAVAAACAWRYATDGEKLGALVQLAPFPLVMLLVPLWFKAFLQHSGVHAFMVNHDFWVFGFAATLAAALILEKVVCACKKKCAGLACSEEIRTRKLTGDLTRGEE